MCRKQFQNGGPSGQAPADFFRKEKVLRPRKNQRSTRLFVYEPLQVRKQVRHPLPFVQNSPLGSIKPAKKGPRIFSEASSRF